MKPKVLSVHYTMQCGLNCPHCYLMKQSCSEKEILKEDWLNLPDISDSYVEKIAIAVNHYKPDSTYIKEECEFALEFFQKCSNNGIKVDVTTDYFMANQMISSLNSKALSNIDVFSISVDSNRMNIEEIDSLLIIVRELKEKGVNSINANFLLTNNCIEWLNNDVLSNLSSIFDTVHIIFQKPFTYTKDEFYNIIERLYDNDVFENEKFIVDHCILFRLGLVDHCHSTTHIVDINPYGSVAGCAYDHFNAPIGKIERIEDLNKLLKETDTKIINRCPYLEFIKKDENNKT